MPRLPACSPFLLVLLFAVLPTTADAKRRPKLQLQPPMPAACVAPADVRFADAPVDATWMPKDAVPLGSPYTWYSQVGGGSAGVGLFVPFGAFINSAAVKKRTEQQAAAMDGGEVVDPRTLIDLTVLPRTADAGVTLEVTPFLHYHRAKKSEVVDRSLVLDLRCGVWAGRYTWHFDAVAPETLEQPPTGEARAAWEVEIAAASTRLFELMQREASGQLRETGWAQVASWQLNPFFKAPLPYSQRGPYADRVVLVGQGEPAKANFMTVYQRGVHVVDARTFEIKDEYPAEGG